MKHKKQSVVYSKSFFDLQFQFVQKITELTELPFEQILLEYTNFYIRLGLGRDFDPAHPTWQEYLTGLQNTNDSLEWTYHFYLREPETTTAPTVVANFGCFSYSLLSDNRIRLHLLNIETSKYSPLSSKRQKERRADLTDLFRHVKQTLPENIRVIGVSWLYNLRAYCRLFPASYSATVHVLNNRFQTMPLWGQFVDRNGKIKKSMTQPFLKQLKRQSCLNHLDECFPFQVLTVEAPVQEFYNFYGI